MNESIETETSNILVALRAELEDDQTNEQDQKLKNLV